jgi:hypothetical protein
MYGATANKKSVIITQKFLLITKEYLFFLIFKKNEIINIHEKNKKKVEKLKKL